jgi:hypothetical protein
LLQILIWGVCVLIIGVGACASTLERIAAGDKKKSFTGVGIWLFTIIAAGLLFALSISQGSAIGDLLK